MRKTIKKIECYIIKKNKYAGYIYVVMYLLLQTMSIFGAKVSIQYRTLRNLKRFVNFSSPLLYNDKIQWLKINWKDDHAAKCADKIAVRRFVKERIGEKYLNKIYDIYESVDDINIEKLPNKFVLKTNHGSGCNIICSNKNNLDAQYEFNKLWIFSKINYYYFSKEFVYKNISRKIICEKFLENESRKKLIDYRFFCFNGEPKFIAIDFDINNKDRTRRNLYDIGWNLLTAELSYPKYVESIIPKPTKLNEMLDVSRKLSRGFPHVRIDLYNVDDKIFFGEMTFFHQSGLGLFRPRTFELEVGNYLDLSRLIN